MRNELTALLVLAVVACGRTSGDGNLVRASEAGADASAMGGAAGSPGRGTGGATHDSGNESGSVGGFAALGGAGGDAGLTILGTVSCKPCMGWYSCWPKGSVPRKGTAPASDCPEPWEVDTSEYPYCAGHSHVSHLTDTVGNASWCCYHTLFDFCE